MRIPDAKNQRVPMFKPALRDGKLTKAGAVRGGTDLLRLP